MNKRHYEHTLPNITREFIEYLKEIDVKIAEVQKSVRGQSLRAEPVMPEPQPAQVIQPVAPRLVPGHAPPISGRGNRYGCSRPNNRPANLPPDSAVGTRPATTTGSTRTGGFTTRIGWYTGRLSAAREPTADHTIPPAGTDAAITGIRRSMAATRPSQPQTASTQTVPDNKGESEYGARAQDMGQYGFDKDDEHDRELLRVDPYEYLDFPEEYRMKDEAQMEMICC